MLTTENKLEKKWVLLLMCDVRTVGGFDLRHLFCKFWLCIKIFKLCLQIRRLCGRTLKIIINKILIQFTVLFFLWFSLSFLSHYIRSTVPVVVGNNFYVVSHQDVSHTFNIRQSYLTRLDSVPASLGSYGSLPGSPPPPPYPIAIQELQLLQELLRQSEAKRSSVDNQRPENNSSVKNFTILRKSSFTSDD